MSNLEQGGYDILSFQDLQDIDFVSLDVERSEKELLSKMAEYLNKDIYPASPIRIVGLTLLAQIIQNQALINDVGKMNLLKYARGNYLDHVASFWDEKRIPAQRSTCTMKFKISEGVSHVVILPQDSRVRSNDGRLFFVPEAVEFFQGETEKDVVVVAEEAGAIGNGIPPGALKTLVDVFPYFESCKNITATQGGADQEDDQHFRDRVHGAAEKLSVAGPDLAYKYWVKSVDSNIGEVEVWSPSPGAVRIVPLYKDGSIPPEEILEKIKNDGITRKRRPLTDKVEVQAPKEQKISFVVKYWIDRRRASMLKGVQERVEQAFKEYKHWQTSGLGRDINPDKLTEKLIAAGAKRLAIEGMSFQKIPSDTVIRIEDAKLEYQGMEEN